MKVRLKDVAERAGVAVNTASTILNRRPNSWASKETEARVFQAAKELGYTPNPAARALRSGRFHAIGLVVPDFQNPFYANFADFLDAEAETRGLELVLESWRNNLEREKLCLTGIVNRQVDGAAAFLSSNDAHRPFLEAQRRAGRPFVALSAYSGSPLPVDALLVDFAPGLSSAIEALVTFGHRRFAFVSPLVHGQDAGSRPTLCERLLAEHGIARGGFDYVTCGPSLIDAHAAASELLHRPRDTRPTAVIAMTDRAAIATIRAASECRLELPRDLSVVGVDNIPSGSFLPVTLSTVAQPVDEMARRILDILTHHIAHPGVKLNHEQVVFPTTFIRRESIGIAQRAFASKRRAHA
jgi:LacI family transcriptional regulator